MEKPQSEDHEATPLTFVEIGKGYYLEKGGQRSSPPTKDFANIASAQQLLERNIQAYLQHPENKMTEAELREYFAIKGPENLQQQE